MECRDEWHCITNRRYNTAILLHSFAVDFRVLLHDGEEVRSELNILKYKLNVREGYLKFLCDHFGVIRRDPHILLNCDYPIHWEW